MESLAAISRVHLPIFEFQRCFRYRLPFFLDPNDPALQCSYRFPNVSHQQSLLSSAACRSVSISSYSSFLPPRSCKNLSSALEVCVGRKGGRSHAAVWYPMRVVKLGLSFTKELQVRVVLSDREFHATDPVSLAQRLAAKPRPNQPRPLRAAINLDPSLCILGTSAITGMWAPLLDVQIMAAYATMSQTTFSCITRTPII